MADPDSVPAGRYGKAALTALGVDSLYGPVGIVIGSVLWTFPHAMLILVTTLSSSDARLIEAAEEALATAEARATEARGAEAETRARTAAAEGAVKALASEAAGLERLGRVASGG